MGDGAVFMIMHSSGEHCCRRSGRQWVVRESAQRCTRTGTIGVKHNITSTLASPTAMRSNGLAKAMTCDAHFESVSSNR